MTGIFGDQRKAQAANGLSLSWLGPAIWPKHGTDSAATSVEHELPILCASSAMWHGSEIEDREGNKGGVGMSLG